eukprot:3682510-Rhodomonas_salina.2
MGYLEDELGESHAIDGTGTYIPGMQTSIFSVTVSRAARLGHLIMHEGHPRTGRHGMTVAGTGKFIPFVWSDSARLWFLQFYHQARRASA